MQHIRSIFWIGLLIGVFAYLVPHAALAGQIYSLNGSLYTSVSASSSHSAPFTEDNLFDQIPVVGSEMSLGSEAGTAYAGLGVGPHYVEFEIDQVQDFSSVFYANRDHNNLHTSAADKIELIEIWADSTTPFAAADPGGTPDASATITHVTDDTFLEYALSTPITGRYFVMRLTLLSGTGGNPGGAEFRLGVVPEPSAIALVLLGLMSLGPLAWRRRSFCRSR